MLIDYDAKDDKDLRPENLIGTERDVKDATDLYAGQDASKIIRTYIEENLPEELKNDAFLVNFWAVLGKKIQLTFLEDKDKYEFYAIFEQARLAYVMSIPADKFDFSTLQRLKQIELYFGAAVRSAIGTNSNKVNERTMLNTAVQQHVVSRTDRVGSADSGGPLSRFAKRMGL